MAPGADPSTATVQWATADATRARVRWSLSPLSSSSSKSNDGNGKSGNGRNSSVFEVEGSTSTYTRQQMCGGPAASAGWFEPGSLHRATLRGLPAASRIFYEVFDASDDEKSEGRANSKAATRFGSFSTPAALFSRERGGERDEKEARIVLMADAGELESAFRFSRQRERRSEWKKNSLFSKLKKKNRNGRRLPLDSVPRLDLRRHQEHLCGRRGRPGVPGEQR